MCERRPARAAATAFAFVVWTSAYFFTTELRLSRRAPSSSINLECRQEKSPIFDRMRDVTGAQDLGLPLEMRFRNSELFLIEEIAVGRDGPVRQFGSWPVTVD
jgi:hypothetical protein